MRNRTDDVARPALYDVAIVNPLGAALNHYTVRLTTSLEHAGSRVRVLSVLEPSAAGRSRVSWLVDYLRAIRRAGAGVAPGGRVLVTWPVLGHIDRLLAAVLTSRSRSSLIMHDPRPLVRAIGYGRVAVAVTSRLLPRAELLVHSAVAEQDLALRGLSATLVPHPLIGAGRATVPAVPVLRVLGQYKHDRDVDLLVRLAERLAERLAGVRLEIVGRRWPDVPGWSVRDDYVSEEEMDELVRTSSAVLIPYKRFYQSGIAARALETAVPVIGPGLQLISMTGDDYPFLVDDPSEPDEWLRAVEQALRSDRHELDEIRTAVSQRALDGWTRWSRS